MTDLSILVDRATQLIAQGSYDEAATLLADLCDLAPGTASAPCMLGELLLTRGDSRGAARAYSEALDRARKAGTRRVEQLARLGRARARTALGQLDDARIDYAKAAQGADRNLAVLAQAGLSLGGVQ